MGAPAVMSPDGLSVSGGGEQVTVLNHSALARRYPEIERRTAGDLQGSAGRQGSVPRLFSRGLFLCLPFYDGKVRDRGLL